MTGDRPGQAHVGSELDFEAEAYAEVVEQILERAIVLFIRAVTAGLHVVVKDVEMEGVVAKKVSEAHPPGLGSGSVVEPSETTEQLLKRSSGHLRAPLRKIPLDRQMGRRSPTVKTPRSTDRERASVQVPDDVYARIAREIESDVSPVGIDAKKTHVLILHLLARIEERLARLERAVGVKSLES